MEEILVSIWCTAYNHEMYIRDAIEGFLSQKTNFQYEIIIHDDASTDSTAEIIREYEEKYPHLIHGVYQIENQYSKYHPDMEWIQRIAIQNCKGKYIALCEGDDYWIDIQKLQIQADYLEAHPECIMTVHDAVNVDCRNYEMKSGSAYDKDCIISPRDMILQKKSMFTASMVYRREVLQMDGFFLDSGIGDYPTRLYALEKGKIFYFTRIMSIYREHHAGSWSSSFLSGEIRWPHSILMIDFLDKYNEYTNKKYDAYVRCRIQKSAMDIINLCSKMTWEEFMKTSNCYFEKMNPKYEIIFKQINRLWRWLFDPEYVDEAVYRFKNMYQRIVIMGAGGYARLAAEKFSKKGITFEGFAVSDDQQTDGRYLGKPVWKLGEMPFDLTDTGIIIGINPLISWRHLKRQN